MTKLVLLFLFFWVTANLMGQMIYEKEKEMKTIELVSNDKGPFKHYALVVNRNAGVDFSIFFNKDKLADFNDGRQSITSIRLNKKRGFIKEGFNEIVLQIHRVEKDLKPFLEDGSIITIQIHAVDEPTMFTEENSILKIEWNLNENGQPETLKYVFELHK